MDNANRFGSRRTASEKLAATVEQVNPNSYFVEYADGAAVSEPRNAINEILFETDLLDADDTEFTALGPARNGGNGDPIDIRFDADIASGEYRMSVGQSGSFGKEITLTPGRRDQILERVIPELEKSEDDSDLMSKGSPDDPWSGGEINEATQELSSDTTPSEMLPSDTDVMFAGAVDIENIDQDVLEGIVEEYDLQAIEVLNAETLEDLTPDADLTVEEDSDDDRYNISDSVADECYQIYKSIRSSMVREDVMADFLERYPAEIDVDDRGWIIHDTFIVTFDGAENYTIDDFEGNAREAQTPNGGSVNYDNAHPFIEADFDTKDEIVSNMGDGSTQDLTKTEQQFLATVEVLMYPETYLDAKLVSEIDNAMFDDQVGPEIGGIAESVSVNKFKDQVSGLVHTHSVNKHTLTASFSITTPVVESLKFTEYDHAGVQELLWREDELRNADFSIFYDTDNRDDERWDEIRALKSNARVPDFVYQELRAEYGTSS